MPNWKKVLVSGSDAALNSLNVTSLLSVTGSSNLTGSLDISGSASILGNTGTTTFYTNADTLIFTGSVYLSGSIYQTGSLNVTSITSSLFGTASWAQNATNTLSASYALTASYALNGGGGGGGGVFSYHQTASAVTWSVSHSLNTYTPIVQVYDEDYNQLIPASISGSSVNTVQITFSTATTGYAVLTTGGNVTVNISGSNATLVQATPATTWSFYHGLNETYPVFTIFDENNDVIIPQRINVENANTASIYFTTARTGTAVAANCGLSGSTFESASWSAYAISSSYAQNSDLLDGKDSTVFATTGSNVFKGSQTIQGNLYMSGSFPLIYNNNTTSNMLFGMFDGSAIYGPYYQLFGNQYSNISQRGGAEFVYDIRNNADANFHISSFNGTTWTQKFLVNDTGVEITGSLNAPSITGSLQGTASWAGNAVTASYVQTAQTASYVLNAVSASYAISASHATQAISSSYALTASYAPTASFSDRTTQIDVYVKNVTGAQINKGTVVRIIGATGGNPLIQTASYTDDNNSANTLGITTANIPNDSFGYVISEGVLTGINTSGYTAGQLLYLGANGTITGSAPQAPLHAVRLGEVLRVQLNNGSMYVRIDNGYELGELHDVRDTTTTASFGDLLVKSGSVWTNSKQLTGSYGLTGSLSATSLTGSLNITGNSTYSGSQTFTTGYIVLTQVSQSLNFADDAAAAAGGVPLGGLYRSGNFILIRIS